MIRGLSVFLCVVFVSFGVFAQEQDRDAAYQERLALAAKMHEIRPARDQVEDAVDQVSLNLPQSDRDGFKKEILEGFDFEELETLSTKAMAEVFTKEELHAMIDYFGSAEAESVAEKLPVYEEMVQPEIVKMLDAALMKLRTGSGR